MGDVAYGADLLAVAQELRASRNVTPSRDPAACRRNSLASWRVLACFGSSCQQPTAGSTWRRWMA